MAPNFNRGDRLAVAGLLAQFRRRHLDPLIRPLQPYRRVSFAGIEVQYERHLDGGGATFGQGFIPFLQSRGMPRQQRVFEWCAGPGFIGFSLLAHGLCNTLCLADINPEAVEACRRTIALNGIGDKVAVYLSDNLKDIPKEERWDLVVSNPPHFVDQYVGNIRGHDPDWRIHREFLGSIGTFLAPNGVVVLQENNAGSTVDTFRTMIEQAHLKIVFVQGAEPQRTAVSRFFYIGVMRAGDNPPRWAQPL